MENLCEGANLVAREVKSTEQDCAQYFIIIAPDLWRRLRKLIHLLAFTDPSLVGLVLDMGHYMFGGGDPLEALKKHSGRIWHIHFKDCHPEIAAKSRKEGWDYFKSVGNGVFCELGKGAVDFHGNC